LVRDVSSPIIRPNYISSEFYFVPLHFFPLHFVPFTFSFHNFTKINLEGECDGKGDGEREGEAAGEQPRKTKKNYANLDAQLKRIALSYNVNNIEEYLIRIAMNLKMNT
jgi:hypothetical protein